MTDAATPAPPGGGRGKAIFTWLLRGSRGRRPCPHCRTRLPFGHGNAACPQCGRATEGDSGSDLRPIDVDFEKKVAEMDGRMWARTGKGAVIATAIAVAGHIPGVSLATAPALFFLQIIWVRLAIIAPYRSHFTGVRRFITRWLSRLVLIPAASFHLGFAHVLGLNLVAVPALFAAICTSAWVYHRWHLVRERDRKPVGVLEKIVLWIVALVLIIVAVMLYAFSAALAALLEGLGA